jgi:hypothetical protein
MLNIITFKGMKKKLYYKIHYEDYPRMGYLVRYKYCQPLLWLLTLSKYISSSVCTNDGELDTNFPHKFRTREQALNFCKKYPIYDQLLVAIKGIRSDDRWWFERSKTLKKKYKDSIKEKRLINSLKF